VVRDASKVEMIEPLVAKKEPEEKKTDEAAGQQARPVGGGGGDDEEEEELAAARLSAFAMLALACVWCLGVHVSPNFFAQPLLSSQV
jgi:hypothetical protein